MDTDGLVVLARFSTRDEFIAKVKDLFLVLTNKIEDHDLVGFSTQVLDPIVARRASVPRPKPMADVEVLPIVKAAGNPYPERVSLGRARNCDVVVRDPSVSKLHAHFRVDQPRLELVDNDSQNGTRVNGRPASPNHSVVVAPGDVLTFGTVTCKLVDAGGLHDLLR